MGRLNANKPRSTKMPHVWHFAVLRRRIAPTTQTNHLSHLGTDRSHRKRGRPAPQLVPIRQPHNLEARRRTDEAIQPLPTTPTLNLERFPTQLATTLRQHQPSLPIHCIGAGVTRGESADPGVAKLAARKKTGRLFGWRSRQDCGVSQDFLGKRWGSTSAQWLITSRGNPLLRLAIRSQMG
jgi:hypothetical protein